MRASNHILKKYPDTWHQIPEFWANLFGSIANGSMACVSDYAAIGFLNSEDERRQEQQRIRKLLDEKLGAK